MSFEDIKGQDSALGVLKECILRDRIFTSYLFVGPDGVGKFLTAKNFAKALNCLDKENKPCERCISCKKIDSKTHPDVFFIEPEGLSFSIGIERIRELIAKANLKPYEGRKKIFIIRDAHSMNAEASNCFLKTLEEPPQDSVFILISRSKELLLPTIVSRCHIIKFSTAPREMVESILKDKFGIDKEKAKILSNFSGGKIGEAATMAERDLINRKNRVIDNLELDTYSNKEELKERLEFVLSFFRDIFLYRAAMDEETVFNVDRLDEIKKMSKKLSLEELDYIIKRIITLRSYIDYNVNPKLIVDVLTNEIKRKT